MSAAERARGLAEESKARVEAAKPPEAEPTYPRFTYFRISRLTLEDKCPDCDEVSDTDTDEEYGGEPYVKLTFWCGCGREWTRTVYFEPGPVELGEKKEREETDD